MKLTSRERGSKVDKQGIQLADRFQSVNKIERQARTFGLGSLAINSPILSNAAMLEHHTTEYPTIPISVFYDSFWHDERLHLRLFFSSHTNLYNSPCSGAADSSSLFPSNASGNTSFGPSPNLILSTQFSTERRSNFSPW